MVLYTIATLENGVVAFKELPGTFTHEQVRSFFDLSWAMTYASCQGTEVDDKLRLWDCAHPYFTRRHLFVALSRGKRADQIDLKD